MLGSSALLLLPLLLVAGLWAAPLTKYDQRQEGELNVHAHLENFVILLIPGGSGLFNIAAKIASGKHHGGKHVKGHAEGGGSKNALEEQSVAVPLGIKSPPYKVDIDADRRTPIILEITAPRITEEQHEVVIAESPTVTFTKTQSAEKEKPSPDSEKSEPEKPEAEEKPASQMDSSEKPSDPEGKPSVVAEKPKESSEKVEDVPSPVKSEIAPPSKPVEKPLKKPVEAVAAVAAPAAAADQKEVKVSTGAERPEVPAKPAAAPVAAPAAAADAPAAPTQASPPKQVAQEAKSRASRLELLRTGLEPSPVQVPCSAHEVRDGRCGRALEPVRITGNYEDAVLLKALRYGLAPAN